MFHKGNVGLDQAGLNRVVAKTRARIERPNKFQRSLDRLNGAAHQFADLFMLFQLQGAEMLVHNVNGIGNYFGCVPVVNAIFMLIQIR